MLTLPDQNDAVATCPPFSPVGPHPQGFFADCNPGQNFPGTRPIAEHFNELIVNLRALLTKAGVTAAKGDPTMLWKAVLNLPLITRAVTLNVAAGGVAIPTNPFGGDPFDSLQSALSFLAMYRIVPGAGAVTIQITAGTFVCQPIHMNHPDGNSVTIAGAGETQTTLQFPSQQAGINVVTGLGYLRDLTLQGQSTGPTASAWDAVGLNAQVGATNVGRLTVATFAGHGIGIGGTLVLGLGTLTSKNNKGAGIAISGGALSAGNVGTIVSLTNNTGTANLFISPGTAGIDQLQTSGGPVGVMMGGAGTQLAARKLGVDVTTNPASITVADGAVLGTLGTPVVGDWWTWNTAGNQPQNFRADRYGFINAGVALAANNKTNCSPAINTLGNVQAYILSS